MKLSTGYSAHDEVSGADWIPVTKKLCWVVVSGRSGST